MSRGAFSFRDINKVLLGAIAVVVTGLGITGAFAVGTLGLLHDRYQMSGVFSDSAGIRTGDLVRVAGLDVGAVTGVKPDYAQGVVVVTWEVDSGVRLGKDTRAEVNLATILGGRFLKLSGPVRAPYLEDLPVAQRQLSLDRTGIPTTVQDALNSTTRTVQQLDVDRLNVLLNQLGDLTADNADQLGPLLTNLAAVTAAVNDRSTQVETLVDNAQRITSTLAAKDQQVAQLVDASDVLLAELAQRRTQLSQLLGSGSEAVSALANVIEQHEASLRTILADLHATLQVTSAQDANLNTSLAFLGPTFTSFGASTRQGPWVDAVIYGLPLADLQTLVSLIAGAP